MQLSPVLPALGLPYEDWSYRPATEDEVRAHLRQFGWFNTEVKDKCRRVISTPLELAEHFLEHPADARLIRAMEDALQQSAQHAEWRRAMPKKTPKELTTYQREFSRADMVAVDSAIHEHGCLIPPGQTLFHAGMWPATASAMLTTDRPLSTTLLPSVALRNAEWGGKAYRAGQLHLWVLHIEVAVKAFVYRTSGTQLGHEAEVLLQAGVRLEKRASRVVRNDYRLSIVGGPMIDVPAIVTEVAVA